MAIDHEKLFTFAITDVDDEEQEEEMDDIGRPQPIGIPDPKLAPLPTIGDEPPYTEEPIDPSSHHAIVT